VTVVWSTGGATAYIDGNVSNPTDSNNENFTSSAANFKVGSVSDDSYFLLAKSMMCEYITTT
jgi:hypothetical protein